MALVLPSVRCGRGLNPLKVHGLHQACSLTTHESNQTTSGNNAKEDEWNPPAWRVGRTAGGNILKRETGNIGGNRNTLWLGLARCQPQGLASDLKKYQR